MTVDASVAAKWLVSEDHRKEARALLGPRIERYAPDLLPLECASAIWKKARRGEVTSAALYLDGIAKLSRVIRIQPGETLLRDATETALVIDRDKVDELIEAWERVAATLTSVVDDVVLRRSHRAATFLLSEPVYRARWRI